MTDEPSLSTGEDAGTADAAAAAEVAAKAAATEATGTPEEIAAKAAEEKAAEEKAGEEKTGAPEVYEDFTLPEGMELDKAAMELFVPLAKEFDLSQEQAQKLIDFDTKRDAARAEAQQAQWDTQNDTWRDEAKADSEFGGANLQASLANVKRVMDKFADDQVRDIIEDSGVGNRLPMLRMLDKIGKAMGEDKITTGLANTAGKKSTAELLYGGTTPGAEA